MSKEYQTAINTLLTEKGEKKGKFFVGTFTSKEVLEYMGVPNTPGGQRHVTYVVQTFYPGSSVERGSRDEGWILHIRIRVK